MLNKKKVTCHASEGMNHLVCLPPFFIFVKNKQNDSNSKSNLELVLSLSSLVPCHDTQLIDGCKQSRADAVFSVISVQLPSVNTSEVQRNLSCYNDKH